MGKDKKFKKDALLMGIDYGEVNIGLALGRNGIATPLCIVDARNTQTAIHEINRYVMENKVNRVVIGLPLTPNGKETEQSKKVRTFAKFFKIVTKKEVIFVNEFRTTQDLKTENIDLGITKIKHGNVDDLSAALILKEYYSLQD